MNETAEEIVHVPSQENVPLKVEQIEVLPVSEPKPTTAPLAETVATAAGVTLARAALGLLKTIVRGVLFRSNGAAGSSAVTTRESARINVDASERPLNRRRPAASGGRQARHRWRGGQ